MNINYYKKLYNIYTKNEKNILCYIQILKTTDIKTEIYKELSEEQKNKINELIMQLLNFYKILKKEKEYKNLLSYNFLERLNGYKNKKNIIEFIIEIIDTPNFFLEFKQILYILSDENRYNYLIKKEDNIKEISKLYSDDFNILITLLRNKIKNFNWGNKKYNSIKDVLFVLIILEKNKIDIIKLYNIKYKFNKDKEVSDILFNYLISRNNIKLSKEIDSITELILYFKKKLNLWEIIDLIFDVYFSNFGSNTEYFKIIDTKDIELQRKTVDYGIKIFLLIKHNLINNINIFLNYI